MLQHHTVPFDDVTDCQYFKMILKLLLDPVTLNVFKQTAYSGQNILSVSLPHLVLNLPSKVQQTSTPAADHLDRKHHSLAWEQQQTGYTGSFHCMLFCAWLCA